MTNKKSINDTPVYIDIDNMKLMITPEGVEVRHHNNDDINFFTWEHIITKKWAMPFKLARMVLHYRKWGDKPKLEKVSKKYCKGFTYECTSCHKIHDDFLSAEKCHWAKVFNHRMCKCHGLRMNECPDKKPIEVIEEPIKEEDEFAWLNEIDRPERKRRR